MKNVRSRLVRLASIAATAAAALAVTGGGAAGQQNADEVEKGWVDDIELELFVDTPNGPSDGPTDARPDAHVWLTGAIHQYSPQDYGGTFPPAEPGAVQPVTIPVHDKTLSRQIPATEPADCFGAFVLRGPRGTPETVLTRRDPRGSGKELAYALRDGDRVIPLSSRTVILTAVGDERLQLDESLGFGGRCWTGRRVG